MKKGSILVKFIFIIMIVFLISRVLGFVWDMFIVKNFGVGMYIDVYNIVVFVLEILFILVGFVILIVFLLMLSKIKVKNGNEEMYGFVNNVINIFFVILFFFFIGIIIFLR